MRNFRLQSTLIEHNREKNHPNYDLKAFHLLFLILILFQKSAFG